MKKVGSCSGGVSRFKKVGSRRNLICRVLDVKGRQGYIVGRVVRLAETHQPASCGVGYGAVRYCQSRIEG